jgi:hypothetical protein
MADSSQVQEAHAQAAANYLCKNGWGELLNSTIRQRDHSTQGTSAINRFKRAVLDVHQVIHGTKREQATLLLMQIHWLEAKDSKHRYGTLLHHYYEHWFEKSTDQNFFHWLDNGEGRTFSHPKCPRSKLEESCVKYLSDAERERYEAKIENGLFIYKKNGAKIHTLQAAAAGAAAAASAENEEADEDTKKYIFVVSPDGVFYVGPKVRGKFHHSSFLAGGATLGAGNLLIEDGVLLSIKPHSGHYMPSAEQFHNLLALLKQSKVDMGRVQIGMVKPPKKGASRKGSKSGKELQDIVSGLGTLNLQAVDSKMSTTSLKEVKDDVQEHAENLEADRVNLPTSLSRSITQKFSQLNEDDKNEFLNTLFSENLALKRHISEGFSSVNPAVVLMQQHSTQSEGAESASSRGSKLQNLVNQNLLPFAIGAASVFLTNALLLPVLRRFSSAK